MFEGDRRFDVVVRMPNAVRDDLEAVGALPDADEPGRALLGGVRAPLERCVLEALGLDPSLAREHWLVGGVEVPAAEVVSAQRAWYDRRPDVVAEGLRRHAERLPLLGLGRALPGWVPSGTWPSTA